MKVIVRWDHITNGKRNDCHECPVALALLDCGFDFVKVAYHELTLRRPNHNSFIVPTPHIVQDFIEQFDKTGEGHPFEFEIPGE